MASPDRSNLRSSAIFTCICAAPDVGFVSEVGSLAGQQGQHFDETFGRLQGDAATDIASMKIVSSAANVLLRATSEY